MALSKQFLGILLISNILFPIHLYAGSIFNINIKSGTELPTIIYPGQTVKAFYTVQNNTVSTRSANFVKWLPQNVNQITSLNSFPDACGATFNFTPKGTFNDSCTLELAITGSTAIVPSLPVGNQVLTVCFPGGKSCTGVTPGNSLNVQLQSQPGVAVAGGSYTAQGTSLNYPLVEAINSNLLSWSSTISAASIGAGLPIDLVGNSSTMLPYLNSFMSTKCVGNFCLAVGQYTNGNTYPLLSISQNGGQSWQTVIDAASVGTALPSDLVVSTDGNVFISTDCVGSLCVVGGRYNSGNSSTTYPLLLVSNNSGQTWTTKVSATSTSPTVPSDLGGGFAGANNLFAVSCSTQLCITAGQYNATSNGYLPIIIQTTDKGNTWLSVVDSNSLNTPALPSDILLEPTINELFSTSCDGFVCIASGQYTNTNGLVYPLLLSTTDKGNIWLSKIDSSSTSLPLDFVAVGYPTSTILRGASCFGSLCVTSGSYNNSNFDTAYPLLLVSLDGSRTWNTKISSSSVGTALPLDLIPDPTEKQNNILNSVSCSGNLCVAVGSYLSTNMSGAVFPLVVVSVDGGNTWQYKISANSLGTSALPGDLMGGDPNASAVQNAFNGVSCKGSVCVAAGNYLSTDTNIYPLVAMSLNFGATWTTVVDSSTLTSSPPMLQTGTLGNNMGVANGGIANFKNKHSEKPYYP